MVEKRGAERSPIELAASYGIGEDPRPEREAKVNNISSGGFCFTSECKLHIGDEINLAVELDATSEVIIAVKVVWAKETHIHGKYSIGVQIIERKGADFDRFVEFYNKQL